MTAILHRERRRTLLPRILSAALLLVALGTLSVSALVWHTEIVDAIDDVGWYPSIAMDGGGNPGIAYHDWSNADLKYAAWTGTRWQVGTVDTVGRVGEHTSLALGTTGPPRISYYDETNADLKYAVYIGPPWSWTRRTVDSVGDVGKYSSLALDGAGSPHISYYDATNADLKYAAWTGAAWEIETVDSAGIVGQYSSLALDAAGHPRISYHDQTNASLKYAAWTGSTWQTETVDRVGEHGQYGSLALDGAGDPHISYYSGVNLYGNFPLKYATRSESGWRIEVVDAQGEVGIASSLALDGAGNPGISYFDNTNRGLKYAARAGPEWRIETVDEGIIVPFTSLALDAAGTPRIGYFDYANGDLKYAWADAPPAPVPPSTFAPTDTDADGIYDDVNGNGRQDFADVVLFFNQMAWIAANEPVSAFDCNANGRIDFADVVWLFNNIDGSPDRTYTVTAIGIGPGVIMPSGNVTVPEGGNITFYLESRGVLPTPYATQNGYVVGNYVLVDPIVAPTPHPIEYEGPFGVTPSYTLHDVRSDHTIYGCFYYVHIWA